MTRLPSAREIKISSLAYEKFPNTKDVFGKDDLSAFDIAKRSPELKKEFELAEEYKEELELLSEEEINKLHAPIKKREEEKRERKIEEIENAKFCRSNMKADHDYWNKADYLTVEEFVALSFDKNPEIINKEYVVKHSYTNYSQHNFYAELKFPKEYLKRLNLLSRSVEQFIESNLQEKTKQIFSKKTIEKISLLPKYYINWAKSKDITLPSEMYKIIEDNKNAEEEKLDNLNRKYRTLLVELQKTLQEAKTKEEQINLLKAQIKDKSDEFEKLKNEKILGITDKRSLLKMIYGMAIDGYGWKPEDKKSPTTKEITDAVNTNCDAQIDIDTVRKWLKASKSLDEEFLSKN